MVYDDYADIGIFAKWVMDAPEIGERAHPSVGRRCPCTRKGIKLVLLTIIAISQPVFVWTFQIAAVRIPGEREMRTGYDPQGQYIEMVGVLLADGAWLVYHAMTPPSKKTLREIENARRRGY